MNPFSTPNPNRRLAHALLALSAVALVAVMLFSRGSEWLYWPILLHATEGAFVGGVCDWLAIGFVYRQVEQKHSQIAEGIGEWIATDLLNREKILSIIDHALRSRELTDRLKDAVLANVGDSKAIARTLDQVWARVEPEALSFLVHYDLNASELSVVKRALGDPAVTGAIQTCLGKALMDLAENPAFRSTLRSAIDKKIEQSGWLANVAAYFIIDDEWYDQQIRSLREMGEKLNEGEEITALDGTTLEKLVALGASAGSGYVSGWNLLSARRRRWAAQALLGHLKQTVFEALAQFIVSERDKILELSTLADYPPVQAASGWLAGTVSQELCNDLGARVAQQLRNQDAREVREMLERKTRDHLEYVRVNGSILGMVLGGLLGVVSFLLGSH